MAKPEMKEPTQIARPRPFPTRQGDIFGMMRDEMDRMFQRFEQSWPRWPNLFTREAGREMTVPEIDIHEDGQQIMIEADLPGVDEKDVSVTLVDGILTIKGERKSEREERSDNYYLAERSCGSFGRSLRLPDSVDESQIEARFDKGVLKIVARKKPEATRAEKRIEIKTG